MILYIINLIKNKDEKSNKKNIKIFIQNIDITNYIIKYVKILYVNNNYYIKIRLYNINKFLINICKIKNLDNDNIIYLFLNNQINNNCDLDEFDNNIIYIKINNTDKFITKRNNILSCFYFLLFIYLYIYLWFYMDYFHYSK